jgi:hypothetical protein
MLRYAVFAFAFALTLPAFAADNTVSGGSAEPEAETAAPETGSSTQIYNGLTVDEAAGLMRDAGYKAVIKTDSSNLSYIESKASGLVFEVNFYGCDGEPARCLQIQFRASFGTSPDQQKKALQYNVDKVFGRAYNSEDSTYIEHPMHINGGVTGDYFKNNLELWDNVLGEFARYIDW